MSITVLLLTILATSLFALGNLVDKWLVNRPNQKTNTTDSPAALVAVGAVFFLLGAIIIWILFLFKLRLPQINPNVVGLLLNGLVFSVTIWSYLSALENDEDIVRVVPFFQLIPVFGIVAGYVFLNEQLGFIAIGAILLLAIGGATLAFKDGYFNTRIVCLMLLSSFMANVNDISFAKFGREIDVLSAFFWDFLGKAVFGLIVLVRKEIRLQFVSTMKTKFGVQAANETIATTADGIFDWVKLFAPVAIVQGLCATQPLFLLVFSVLLSKFLPGIHKEDYTKRAAQQKVVGISLMVIGGIMLSK